MTEVQAGVVSVILVNFRGPDDTIEALTNLAALHWPKDRLEVVVVDNESGDDSVQRIRAAHPSVSIIESGSNLGFAGGCNRGVSASSGEFVAFLNSDARPDSGWIGEAMRAFDEDPAIGAVASRVLDWEGETVDYVDAALTGFGMGWKPLVGLAARGRGLEPQDVLFGTGSAMFVRREVFDRLCGFDERFFMFFEDVDLGWRLNLLGLRYRYQPTSIAFHRHHGAVDKFGAFKEQYYLERNALFSLYKNLDDGNLGRMLPAAMALSVRRGVAKGARDSTELDFRSGTSEDTVASDVSKLTLASVYAIDQFVEQLPSLIELRDEIQSTRIVSDRAIRPLFRNLDAPSFGDQTYLDGYENLVHAFDPLRETTARKVLVITGDPLGVKLAGPAIRAWNIAEALSVENEVTLVTTSLLEELDAPFELRAVRPGDDRAFASLEAWADVIVLQGHAIGQFDALQHTEKIVVVDIYDPMHLEQLEQGRELPAGTWDHQVADATRVMNDQLRRGDFFVCASERQRLFYLGQLSALGRINPATYTDDSDLRRLLDVVPFGLSNVAPVHERDVLKGVKSGIAADDRLLIWAGGVYNWFDPLTLIRAVADVAGRHASVKLFFLGTKHPHPGVPEMEIVARSRALAAELNVLGTAVVFNDSWVDFADRQNFLLEADAGVSTHHLHVETTFSFRTRILDYLWAGLPMVVTEGDSFAELVESEGLGIVVPAENHEALAEALEKVLFDEDFRILVSDRIAVVRQRFFWSETLAPLVRFVADARRAPDHVEGRLAAGDLTEARSRPPRRRKPYGFRHNVERVAHHLVHGGPAVVWKKIAFRLSVRQ